MRAVHKLVFVQSGNVHPLTTRGLADASLRGRWADRRNVARLKAASGIIQGEPEKMIANDGLAVRDLICFHRPDERGTDILHVFLLNRIDVCSLLKRRALR